MKRLCALVLTLILCAVLAQPCAAVSPSGPLTEAQRQSLLAVLCEADIPSLRRALDSGVLSCEELTAWYLERIEAYNGTYNCFITLCDNALEEARKRDAALAAGTAEGALFGIPVVVKDNIHVAGYPTTNGHRLSGVSPSRENAEIVDRLLAQGAVILGKTNMSTDAQDARVSYSAAVGETRNAYGTDLASGGSSGGSAVAVSLNFAAAGLGTDTNSSLRYPAALNGCVALRPTTGLVSREGVIKLNGYRDAPGAITRTVYDQAVLLDVLTGGNYAENLNGDALEGMRIGVLKQLAGPLDSGPRRAENLDPEVMAAFERAVRELEACGAEVVEVSMPKLFAMSDATFQAKSAMDPLSDYLEQTLAENNVAALIFPTYLTAPLRTRDEAGGRLDVYAQPYITNVRTLAPCAGVPEITVPLGTHSRGAGMGLEIVSARNSEQLLLDIAYAYTRRYDHRVVPAGAPELHPADGGAASLARWLDDYEASLLPPEAPVEEETVPQEPAPSDEDAAARPAAVGALAAAGILALSATGVYLWRRKPCWEKAENGCR